MTTKKFTYCETLAAYRWHIREVLPGTEPLYTGFRGQQPTTLCELKSSWDLKVPITEKNLGAPGICVVCFDKYKEELES